MANKFKLPVFLILLDGLGVALLVMGILAATGTNLGLPALDTLWPYLLGLGVLLMVPMMVWVVRQALSRQKTG